MGQRPIHRLDTLEILCIKLMLTADTVLRLSIEIFAERVDNRIENRDAWHFEAPATIAQLIAQYNTERNVA